VNWEVFYLACFFVGLVFSVVGVLGGMMHLHLPARFHLPEMHIGHWHPHLPAHGAHLHKPSSAELPFFNMATLMVFVCWFGGIGYLLTQGHVLASFFIVLLATFGGLFGSWMVYRFMRLLMKHEKPLDPHDFEMIGVVGNVVVSVRQGGTGEMVYLQAGTRRVCGIRSENGTAIPKGAEVVVTRYEKGIAFVRVWEEFADEHGVAVAEK
jgi:hypothetical protein